MRNKQNVSKMVNLKNNLYYNFIKNFLVSKT